jgi:glycosyltransferase involved in cell wall biosynthesis
VLLIAHGFPPTGGSGSNRALAFARYLPMSGWAPIVLTPEVRVAANRDDALLAEVPRHVRVVRTRSREAGPTVARAAAVTTVSSRPSALRRQLGHLKRFPDAHAGWLPFAVRAALREDFDVIYSSSGPFTSHLVGLAVRRLTGKPWVAELRDGWYEWNRAVFPDYPSWRGVLERRLEGAVIRGADRVVLVTERMARAFRRQYADLPAGHFAVVSNGFDPAQRPAPQARSDGFEVIHAGALYYGRSLEGFMSGAERAVDADPALGGAFRLTLLGTLDATARAEVARHALGDRVQFRGYVDHAASLAAMRGASLLLLIANTTVGAEATVPGKLFEYLASRRPVLAIVPSLESSTADVLALTGAGWAARADDPERIACAIGEAFRGRQPRGDERALARFDRRILSGQLAAVLDEVRAARRL